MSPKLSGSLRPLPATKVAARWVEGSLILAGEQCSHTVVLDGVSGIVWESLDGTTSIGEIAADIADLFGGTERHRRSQLLRLVEELAREGFLKTPTSSVPPLPRRIIAKTPEDSCLGRRIGLSRAHFIHAESTDGTLFRFGCTIGEISEAMGSVIDPRPEEDGAIETLVLRASASPTGRPRLQQIFDTMGNSMYVGRNLPLAVEAFHRTVTARLDSSLEPWLRCLVVQREGRALLVHPALNHVIVDQGRETLHRNGVDLVPTSFVKLNQDGTITTPLDRFGAAQPRTWQFVGVLSPETSDPVERYRLLLDLALRWDDLHLPLIDVLFALDISFPIASIFTAMDVIEAINRAL